jgi:hypothetical protein
VRRGMTMTLMQTPAQGDDSDQARWYATTLTEPAAAVT